MNNIFSFRFNAFVTLNIVSLLLISSWSYSATREYWDLLDQWVFDATNPLLNELRGAWSWFWAVLSIRIADLIPFFLFCGFSMPKV
ncbi:membrane protein [Bathymodiolus azoricus thioautotrophic gill symbiont]|uniref:Membrane protein n=1 Tax=Bathymodiolus azoricus thioautotrophic gill symbiont TaxID=235205 RepID=A0A1H6KBM8_9GAMM|nr:membrane protein [Bathymodiolus azoricus thioautotrophic gill symbiont]